MLVGGDEVGLKKIYISRERNMFYAQGSGEQVSMKDKVIIAASLSKLVDAERGAWWISKSGCKMRATSISKHIGDRTVVNGYIPCLFHVSTEGVRINVRSAFLKGMRGEATEENRKRFKEIIGLPVSDNTPLTKKRVVYGTEIKDERVRDKLNRLRKYMVNEKKKNEGRRRIFTEVMERVAERGSPDIECLHMMQKINPKGDMEKRAQYRIGAFLPNGGIFLEFTRYAYKSNDVGWFPLKFKTNSEGNHILAPIKNGKENVIAELLLLPRDLKGIQPKILCVLKDKNGKKVVNGCIYSMEEIRKNISRNINNDCEIPIILKDIENYNERRIVDNIEKTHDMKRIKNTDENGRIVKNKKISENLPITVMNQSDQWHEHVAEFRENCNENVENHGSADMSEKINCGEKRNSENADVDEIILEDIEVTDMSQNNSSPKDKCDNIREMEDIIPHVENCDGIKNINLNENCENKIKKDNVNMSKKCNNDSALTCLNTVTDGHETRVAPGDGAEPPQPERQSSPEVMAGQDPIDVRDTGEIDDVEQDMHASGGKARIEPDNTESAGDAERANERLKVQSSLPQIQILGTLVGASPTTRRGESTGGAGNAPMMQRCACEAPYDEEGVCAKFQNYDIASKCMLIVASESSDVLNLIVRVEQSILIGRNIKVDIVLENGNNNIFKSKIFNGIKNIAETTAQTKKNEVSVLNVKQASSSDADRTGIGVSDSALKEKKEKKKIGPPKITNVPKIELDLYGRGKVPSMWDHIGEERMYMALPSCIGRGISQLDKKRVRNILRRSGASKRMAVWTNLPRCLEGRDKWLWGTRDVRNETNPAHLCITQFYKGAFGKAFATLMETRKDEVEMELDQVIELFPRASYEWKLSPLPLDQKGKVFVTTNEVKSVLCSSMLPNGRSTGFSGLTYEVIRAVCKGEDGWNVLAETFNFMLTEPEKILPQLHLARLIGIPKPKGGARPLCIQESLIKVLNKILTAKITSIVRDQIVGTQKCIAKTEGQIQARDQVLKYMEDGYSCFIQFDFKNAFGTVSREAIIRRLLYYSIDKTIVNYIITLFNNQKVVFERQGNNETIDIQRGVPQGEPLSMVLFALGIDELLVRCDSAENMKATSYADDIILSVKDTHSLGAVIDNFENWAGEYGLSINAAKTFIGIRDGIQQDLRDKLNEIGINIVELRNGAVEYVGLPLTLCAEAEIKFVEDKVEKAVAQTEELWAKRVPVQVKYHLQRMCIDSELEYIFKATDYGIVKDNAWLKDKQNRLEMAWSVIGNHVPEKFRRLPVKFYGAGLLHLRDRWRYVRDSFVCRMQGKEDDIVAKYYKTKINKWKEVGKMPEIDIDKVPPRTNVSLAAPPSSRTQRLSDDGFRLMLSLRYNSEAFDVHLSGIDGKRQHMCKYHPNLKMTLQHIISCAYIGKKHVIEQHERISQIITSILRKNKRVTDVIRENYSERQKSKAAEGLKAHRADITFKRNGMVESVDVIVTSSNSHGRGNNVTRARSTKQREYGEEEGLHIVLFDTTGNLTNESWNFLESIGARMEDLRVMQKVIYECTERKIKEVIENNKYNRV